MKKIIGSLALTLALGATSFAQSNMKVDLSAFPKAEKGYKMVVIEVPHSENDDSKKIEFFAGKNLETDSCNTHNLQGTFENSELKGWGYNYYTFKTNGNVMTTNMGCSDTKKIFKFVKAEHKLVRYNGRMPIVIYVPEEYEVRFKIYKSEAEEFKAAEIATK